jgi:hypothetical protein
LLKKKFHKIKTPFSVHRIHLGLFLLILVGLIIRLKFITSVSFEVPNWFACYKTLVSGHILDFYQIMGYKGTGYVYPPVWMLFLTVLASLNPVLTLSDFTFYVKIPIIAPEVLTTLVLYRYIFQKTSSVKYALLSGGLFFLNPFVIKISAYQAMFDVIGCFFLLCAVYLLDEKRYVEAGIVTGLALMTKQYLYIAFPLVVAAMIKQVHWKNLLKYVAGTFFTVAIISAPFCLTTPEQYLDIVLCRWNPASPASIRADWTRRWFPLSGVWYIVRFVATKLGTRVGVGDYYDYLNKVIALYCLTLFMYLIQYRLKILPDYPKVALTASALFILAGLAIHPQYLIFPIVFSCAVIVSRRTVLWGLLPATLVPYYLPDLFPSHYLLEDIPGIVTASFIGVWSIGVLAQNFLNFSMKIIKHRSHF